MEPSFYFVRDSTRFSELPRPPPNPPQYKLGVQKHARIQRGWQGVRPPEKSQKYRFSWNSRKFSKLWSQHSMWTIICTPAKRHLNGVSLAGRHWSAFSGIWIRSPGLKLLSVLQSWTPSDKTFLIRAWKESIYRSSDANPTGSDPGLHYVEYVSRACPSV